MELESAPFKTGQLGEADTRRPLVRLLALLIGLALLAGAAGVFSYRQSQPAPAVDQGNNQPVAMEVQPLITAAGDSYPQFALAAAEDPTILAVGDIACDPNDPDFQDGDGQHDLCQAKATAEVVASRPAAKAILVLGDTQYGCGGATAFDKSYNLSWGQFKDRTRPVIGNHEYVDHELENGGAATDCDPTAQAAGYFSYFGDSGGVPGRAYYSFDIGAWHLIALDTGCMSTGVCPDASAQLAWLQTDLATHPERCTLAYFHHPFFSQDTSGGQANPASLPFWQQLYGAGADLILNGHSHNYQRFEPLTPAGKVDPQRGIVEIVAGTGGARHTPMNPKIPPIPVVADNKSYGVLELTLHQGSYDWKFLANSGSSFTDSGTAQCHD